MSAALAPETPAEQVRRLRAKGWGPARILSGMGHPGYGRTFSAAALARIEKYECVGVDAFDALRGGRDYALKVEAYNQAHGER